jgi:hypothetical protein
MSQPCAWAGDGARQSQKKASHRTGDIRMPALRGAETRALKLERPEASGYGVGKTGRKQ